MVLNGGISAANPPLFPSSSACILHWTLLVPPDPAGICLAEIPSSEVQPGPTPSGGCGGGVCCCVRALSLWKIELS